MSRIGNLPITVPSGATLEIAGSTLRSKGPKGQLEFEVPQGVTVEMEGNTVTITRKRNDKKTKALHGLVRARLANDLKGVTEGWTKTLELHGVGYRASITGRNLVMNLGFSHPVTMEPPEGLTYEVKEGKIVVTGIDKQKVGQAAADIRAVKKPEPYKGKGIRYSGEYVRKKAGKAAKAVGG